MTHDAPSYGLWTLALVNAAVFILFAFSFTQPKTSRDWRALGGFAGFMLALFTEMYGFPLTIYLLSGWLGARYPGLDLMSHDAGHLWSTLVGMPGDPHLTPPHLLSYVAIFGGFVLLSAAWRELHAAQRAGRLATAGPYAWIRHPQYVAFILVMFGFLLQWPTLLTLVMFPILAWSYVRLARAEERDSIERFGEAYLAYARRVPAFVPRLRQQHAPLAR
jgi:protein-S-isoprenylcysteine O-methyltransferase Ste14